MKKLNLFAFFCALPIFYILLVLFLETLFGCSGGAFGDNINISCAVESYESLFEFLERIGNTFMWFSLLFVLPGICFSFVSFYEDYKQMKLEKKKFSEIFKKFSFYLALFFFIPCLILFLILIVGQIQTIGYLFEFYS